MRKLVDKINTLQEENNRLRTIIKEAHNNIAAGSGFINNGEVDCVCKICQEDGNEA